MRFTSQCSGCRMRRATEEPQMQAISREEMFKRLNFLLQLLAYCCYEDGEFVFVWPSGSLLGSINVFVAFLIELELKRRPFVQWKHFEALGKRRRSLRLVPRINSMVKRAIERRKEKCSESSLEKALRRPDSLNTQILLRDFMEQPGKFVDLLNDHDSRVMERHESRPLLDWLCNIHHPGAKNLILPDVESVRLVGAFARVYHLEKVSRKRLKNRERQRRYRQRKNSLPEKRYRRTH
jgi:hypothetical protein